MPTGDRSVRVRLEANVVGFVAQVGGKAVAAVEKLEGAAAKANATLKKTASDAGGIGEKIGAGATKATGHLETLALAAQKNSQGFNTLASGATKVGLAAAAGLGLSAKAAVDWETAWTGVTKTVNGSTAQMAQLEGELRNMAKTLPESHAQIAAVAEAAGQLGVRREDIAGFTKVMVDLGETTNLTSDEAATSLAQLMNVMGTAPQNVGRLGAAIVALGNNGASTEKDIVSMAQRISGSGKLVGLSEQQVLAYAAALANVGIEAEAGGTAISQVFTKIDKAVSGGGQGLADFAKVSGMSADQYKQKWQTDASGATQAFIEGLGQIHQAGGDVNGTLATLGITEIRQRDAVLRLAESGTNLSDMLKTSNDGWRDNTALINEATKRYGTTASQIQIAWNQIKDAAITAGAVLLPVIADVAKTVGSLASAFGKLPGPVRDTALVLTSIVAVGGLVVGAALRMVTSLGAARTAMASLGASSKTAGAAMGALGKAGIAGVAIVGMLGVVEAVNKFKAATSTADVSKLSADLIRFAATGKSTGELLKNFGNDFSGASDIFGRKGPSLAEAMKNVGDSGLGLKGKLEVLGSAIPTATNPLAPFNDNLRQSRARIGEVDQALAALVQGGNQEQATAAFQGLSQQAASVGINVDTLKAIFPEYGRALQAAGVDAEVAGGKAADAGVANKGLATSLEETQQQATDAAAALKAYIDELFQMPNMLLGVRDAQRGVQAAIDDATAAVKENGKTLDIHTPKGRANQAALDAITASANKQSEAYINSNASQKTMTAGAAEARTEFVKVAIRMGMNKAAAKAMADEYIKTPKMVATDFTNNADGKPKTDAQTYADVLRGTLPAVNTIITNNGAGTPKTNAERYRELLGLVPRAVPTVVTNTAPVAQTKVDQYRTALGLVPQSKSTSVSTPGATASQGQVSGLLGLLGALPPSKSVTINTYKNMIETTTHKDIGVKVGADGFFSSPTMSFADGKLPSQAMVAPGKGSGLVQWAEQETGGEAFIPLAPSKRDRSEKILSQVASSFGLGLVRSFADGGFLPGGNLVDVAFLLRQLGVGFNPSAGVNYGNTLKAQNAANSQVGGARTASNSAAAAEAAAKADVARIQRAITLQQRYVTSLKQGGASDAKVKAEQKETIALQDQLYRSKQRLTGATNASNRADATLKQRQDAAAKATEAHAVAVQRLVEQQKAAVDMAAQIASGLTSSANIGDLFQQSLTGKGLLADLQGKGAQLGAFKVQIDRLRKQGLSEDLIQQLVGKGADQGGQAAQAILDGGLGLIAALNKAQKALDAQANLIGAGSATKKYGQAISGARAGGGPVAPNKAYVVGENGPEVLRMGSRQGWVDPNRYIAGGAGGVATTIHHHHQTLQFTGVSMAEADLIAQRANAKAELMAKGY